MHQSGEKRLHAEKERVEKNLTRLWVLSLPFTDFQMDQQFPFSEKSPKQKSRAYFCSGGKTLGGKTSLSSVRMKWGGVEHVEDCVLR